jgi:hypothetical protein
MHWRTHSKISACGQRQRGAAVLLLIITLIVMMTIVLAPRMTVWQMHNTQKGVGSQALIDVKAAILAYAANPGADSVPGRRLGQILLTPDLPVAAGTTFDGQSKAGCATRNWRAGLPLIDPNVYAVPLDVRCFGRFPWLSFGLSGPNTSDDQNGEIPWVFMSANLVVGAPCLSNLNPLMLSKPYTGGCGTAVPFPWLKVVDGRGNLLSSEVAIVLILPGAPIANAQRRVAPADGAPAAYLDSLTVAAACPAPCVPGTYNNAAYTLANGAAWTFIDAPSSTELGPQPPYYTQPFAFNDRLIYITAGEYFEAMEQRARLAALNALAQFRAGNGYLPYSGDNPSTPFTTSCALQSRFGLLPTAANCGGTLTYPAWYTAAGWGSYFIYAVDPGCVASAAPPRCAAPSLQLGGAATRYNAVLFSPGRAIVNPPYAASKGAAQAPLGSGSFADFLDSARNVSGPPFDAAGTAPSANYDDRMYGIP